jgi:hypothetical protein
MVTEFSSSSKFLWQPHRREPSAGGNFRVCLLADKAQHMLQNDVLD